MSLSPRSKKRSTRNESFSIAIFAKEPILGKVKTRLQEAFPAEVVRDLYRCFLLDTLALVTKVPRGKRWIFYEAFGHPPHFLKSHAKGFTLRPQRGKNLGDRLSAACRAMKPSALRPVIIIGADTPHLNPKRIHETVIRLKTYDVVIGPSRDGGFYLLGLRTFKEDIFEKICWSTAEVLGQLRKNLRKEKLTSWVLPIASDIDTPEDLNQICRKPRCLPLNFRQELRQNDYLKVKFSS